MQVSKFCCRGGLGHFRGYKPRLLELCTGHCELLRMNTGKKLIIELSVDFFKLFSVHHFSFLKSKFDYDVLLPSG